MKLSAISKIIEAFAPPALQENYDNSGLLVGSPDQEVERILISLDITDEVVNEAIDLEANFILVHHPVIFKPLKSLTGKNEVERCVIACIKHNIAIYAAHTNADSTQNGVSAKMAEKLGLKNISILSPAKSLLKKIVVFTPVVHAQEVREAMFNAGAGHIGDYDQCSYNLSGQGTFRGLENSNPFTGEKGKLHFEPEERVETVVPHYFTSRVISEMIKAHPYEEVAYDIYPLENTNSQYGLGVTGDFEQPLKEEEFLKKLKDIFAVKCIRHSPLTGKKIQTVALCGGSGSFLLSKAKSSGAQAFVTADVKYHEFFDLKDQLLLADIGHYESEQYTKDIFYELLTEKLTNFAVHLSKVNTNPINYY